MKLEPIPQAPASAIDGIAPPAARRPEQGATTIPATAGLIHDLGNLIQLATSALGMIGRSPEIRSGRLAALTASASASLERAGRLVHQALGAACGRTATIPTAWPTECLAEVEASMRGALRPDIHLDVRIEPGLPAIACDPLGLQRAVLNLLFNARDAMTGGGVIQLRAGRNPRAASSLLELQVIDNGIGMTAETAARAFDPFFTTRNDGVGGIGLPLVARFARECGGEVTVDSVPGLGTTIVLRLPFARQSEPRSPLSQEPYE